MIICQPESDPRFVRGGGAIPKETCHSNSKRINVEMMKPRAPPGANSGRGTAAAYAHLEAAQASAMPSFLLWFHVGKQHAEN